jgi:photosystem II stability/assembly factor-like uncharacterized protein
MPKSKCVVSLLVFWGFLFCVLLVAGALRAQTLDESLWSAMKWRSIGPFRGGRVLAAAGVPGDPNTYYFGGVAGGVFKSTDAGLTWVPLFDQQPVSSIGAIAVAPSDPNVLYVGTGEGCLRGNISYGNGMYKSVDSGATWTHIGLDDTQHISHVIVDPRNPDIVLVAAVGHAFGPNAERGVFRSTDGGKSWSKVLYKDDKTGAIDLIFDPTNSHIVYAALYQILRLPWGMESGGPGSGIYKSSDGGATWKHLEGHGLPEGILGRIGLAVSGADPSRVYALIEAKEGGLYRSDDAGAIWQKINDDTRFRQRAWYFTHIFADPKSASTIYVLNTGLFRSTDGGHSFTLLPAPHGDHHGLWIDPTNPSRMINTNDGGVTITVDGGKTWTKQDNQPTAQFYHVSTDNQFPYWVYGAQQDNSTVGIASRTSHGVIDESDWNSVGGGESGYIVADPRDSNIIYAGDNWGMITRWDKRTQQAQDITVWPVNPSGYGVISLKHRFQWTAPIVVSPHDPSVLYQGGEMLFKTTNNGMRWTPISPDLTRNDKSKQEASGGQITKDNTSVEYYDTIFSIAESPLQKDLLWVGTDDGLVQMTRDGGVNWTNVTPKGMPEWSLVSLIEASPHAAGTAYLAVDCHKLDDLRPYIYRSSDFGRSWTKITTGIPNTAYVHAVREDPVRKGMLFAGTERGIFVSFDDGAHWQPLQLNLPPSPIHDLVIHGDDLIVATHGRSFWILDDITPLRQAEQSLASHEMHLYKPQTAIRFRTGGAVPERVLLWYGENSPNGAVINYYFQAKPKDEVKLEILDAQGKVIRKLSSKPPAVEPMHQQEWPDQPAESDLLPAEKGMNRSGWDLRYDEPINIPGVMWDGGDGPKGPRAAPGKYQVKLTAGSATETVPLELVADPRVKTSQADFEEQLALALKISASISRADETVNQIRDVRAQLAALKKRLGSDEKAKAIAAAADAIDMKMTPVEEALNNPNVKASEDSLNYPVRLNDQLSSLQSFVESADMPPTAQALAAFEDLSAKVDAEAAKWKEIAEKDLAALNESMRKENIPAVAPAPAKKE